MPLLLNIETATDVCSVSLSKGRKVLQLREIDNPQLHSTRLTLMIKELIKSENIHIKNLSAIAISSGPGSYTGLRIGSSVAKGICHAIRKPLIVVDTLSILASAAIREMQEIDQNTLFCAMIDARRMEVYYSIFDSDLRNIFKTSHYIVRENSFSEYFNQGKKIIFCGNGTRKCKILLHEPQSEILSIACSARYMPNLSYPLFKSEQFEAINYFQPLYLKGANIT